MATAIIRGHGDLLVAIGAAILGFDVFLAWGHASGFLPPADARWVPPTVMAIVGALGLAALLGGLADRATVYELDGATLRCRTLLGVRNIELRAITDITQQTTFGFLPGGGIGFFPIPQIVFWSAGAPVLRIGMPFGRRRRAELAEFLSALKRANPAVRLGPGLQLRPD